MKYEPSWHRGKCVAAGDEGWRIYEEFLHGYENGHTWYRLLNNEGKSEGLFSSLEWCIQVARENFGKTSNQSMIDEIRECERRCEEMYWQAVDEQMREIYLRHSSRGFKWPQEQKVQCDCGCDPELPLTPIGEELIARLSK